jgi:CHASE2 domain-containing sensor protein
MPGSRRPQQRRSVSRLVKLVRVRSRAAFRRYRRSWKRQKTRDRDFIKNIAIGCFVGVFVIFLESLGMLAGIQHSLLDWQIGSVKGTSNGNDIAFIDIDEGSAAAFGQDGIAPYFTPRDKLQRLIAAAVTAKASVVVVDIDLSQPPGPGSFADAWRELYGHAPPSDPKHYREARQAFEKLTEPPNLGPVEKFYFGNWQLARYLAQYARACARQRANACVPIVLARTVRVAPGSGPFAPAHASALERIETFFFGARPSPPERLALPSFIDADLTRSSGVLWGSVTFDRDDDYVVRRWRLWEPVCLPKAEGGGGDALPSSALLAVAFFHSRSGVRPPFDDKQFESSLAASYAPVACGPETELPAIRNAPTPAPVYGIELTREDRPRTVRYRISWNGGETSLAHVIPAALLTGAPTTNFKIDCRLPGETPYCVRGKIVVIGSTYRDNGDYHRVPGGELPGSIVLINMIDSLAEQSHDFGDVPRGYAWLLELVLILLLSLAFRYCENETGVLVVASVAIVALCLPLSFVILLTQNLWFDITPPLIGIVLHEAKVLADRARSARKVTTR